MDACTCCPRLRNRIEFHGCFVRRTKHWNINKSIFFFQTDYIIRFSKMWHGICNPFHEVALTFLSNGFWEPFHMFVKRNRYSVSYLDFVCWYWMLIRVCCVIGEFLMWVNLYCAIGEFCNLNHAIIYEYQHAISFQFLIRVAFTLFLWFVLYSLCIIFLMLQITHSLITFNNQHAKTDFTKNPQKNPKRILNFVSPQFKKKKRNGMCIPFHTPPTRITQSVSAQLKKKQKRNAYSVSYASNTDCGIRFCTVQKKKHKRNVYSVSYTSDTDYTTRFSKTQKKKWKKQNVYSVSPASALLQRRW